jgi:hypothetical protein
MEGRSVRGRMDGGAKDDWRPVARVAPRVWETPVGGGRRVKGKGPSVRDGKAAARGPLASPLGARRKVGTAAVGPGPGMPLGPGGAPWERTPSQPSPQDCSNWLAPGGANRRRFNRPRKIAQIGWSTPTVGVVRRCHANSQKLAKGEQITMGVAAGGLRRSRGQTNPQDRAQRSWGRRSAIECRGRRGGGFWGHQGPRIPPVEAALVSRREGIGLDPTEGARRWG